MKIVIVGKNPFFYEDKNSYLSGHTVGLSYQLINFLLKKKHEVVFISPNEKNNLKNQIYKTLFPLPPKNENFRHIFIEPKKLDKIPFEFPDLDVKAAIYEARELLGQVDYVLSIYAFPWIMPINDLKPRLGYKTWALLQGTDVTKGSNPVSQYNDIYGDAWKRMAGLMQVSINQSDHVSTASGWLKNFSETLGIKVHSIIPTPPFACSDTLKNFPGGSLKIKKLFLDHDFIKKQIGSLDTRKPWLIYLGRFHKEKRVDLVIKSFAASKNCHKAHLIMGGKGAQFYLMNKMIKRLCLKNVSFCFVPPNLVPLLCKSASAMIQPWICYNKIIDAGPSSCTNAAQVGCPVIIPFVKNRNDFGGAHESLGDLNIEKLSYDPFCSETKVISQIGECIDLVLESKSLREEIAKANIRSSLKFQKDILFNRLEKELAKK